MEASEEREEIMERAERGYGKQQSWRRQFILKELDGLKLERKLSDYKMEGEKQYMSMKLEIKSFSIS